MMMMMMMIMIMMMRMMMRASKKYCGELSPYKESSDMLPYRAFK